MCGGHLVIGTDDVMVCCGHLVIGTDDVMVRCGHLVIGTYVWWAPVVMV